MGWTQQLQVDFTIYLYFVAVTLEYAAKCMMQMLTGNFLSHKALKAVLFVERRPPIVVPQRLNLGVFVLLHELYPAKEASAAVPVDRTEQLSAQDFIMALQKIDLESALGASNADDVNFIFQTNQLPLSCFTGEPSLSSSCLATHEQLSYKPGPSCIPTMDAEDDDPELSSLVPAHKQLSSSSSIPTFSPMIADPAWVDSDKSDLGEMLTPSVQTPPDAEFQSAREMSDPIDEVTDLVPCEPPLTTTTTLSTSSVHSDEPDREEIEAHQSVDSTCGVALQEDEAGLLGVSDVVTIQSEGICLKSKRGDDDDDDQGVTLPSFHSVSEWGHKTECESLSPTPSDPEDVDERDSHEPAPDQGLSGFASSTTTATGNVASSSAIQRSTSLNRFHHFFAMDPNRSTSELDSKRPSRRKSVLRPLSTEIRSSRSTSLSSASEVERSGTLQDGYSSDSELDYRQDGGKYFRARGRGLSVLKPEPSCASSSSVLSSPAVRSGTLFDTDSARSYARASVKYEGAVARSPPPSARRSDFWDTSDEGSSFLSFPSTSSRRMERHLRDVDQLQLAKVPFTYEQVVYCSHAEFKELRSTPNLTSHQISAMLDARRRATNRQAAERCRRLKTALRDELSQRLSELRLQRQQLTKKLVRARQRKQEAKDMFVAEQKRVLSMLRGPNGDRLNYGDWRVRLTNEDEVVVVAAGR